MSHDLANSVRTYKAIKEQLALEYDLLPEDQYLLDTVDGLTDLPEVITALVRDAKRTEAMAEAIKIIIADNQARRQRFEAKSVRLRTLALWAMNDASIPKITAPDMTITQSPGMRHVIITDENAVPDDMCVITRRPDKNAIREKLKSNEFVPYATLSNIEPVLKVHTK